MLHSLNVTNKIVLNKNIISIHMRSDAMTVRPQIATLEDMEASSLHSSKLPPAPMTTEEIRKFKCMT